MMIEILDQIIWSHINSLPETKNLSTEEKTNLYNEYKNKMFHSAIIIKSSDKHDDSS